MGKIVALLILLLVANLALIAWILLTRRRGTAVGSSTGGSGPGSGECHESASGSRSTACQDTYREPDDDPVVNNNADTEDCAVAVVPWVRPDNLFLSPPAVQIGADASRLDCVELIFFAKAELHGFSVGAFSDRQLVCSELKQSPIWLEGIDPHRRWSTTISGLKPGQPFKYWVIHGGKIVHEAFAQARKAPGQAHRFVVVGDMGNGSVESCRIAHHIYAHNKPDLLAITGDVVYMHGRASEYLRRFLPVYNATVAEPGTGAPLLAQVLSFTSIGNHCVGKVEHHTSPSFSNFPDLHAFFLYWSLPLNGPLTDAKAKNSIPELIGDETRIDKFLKAAGNRFPQMGMYSFDYGDAHWLVLDANAYMDWTREDLRAYVEADLKAAQGARWRFVNLHQPPFTSNPKHKQEKRMRLLADLFQKYGVDIVFCGHAHYYERCYPLNFTLVPGADGKPIDDNGQVRGDIAIDKNFDGVTVTKPNGVIYLVTGGGGAKLDPSGIHWRPEEWKPFTHKLIGDRHSYTVCDLDGNTLTVKQVDFSGKEIDRFVVTK